MRCVWKMKNKSKIRKNKPGTAQVGATLETQKAIRCKSIFGGNLVLAGEQELIIICCSQATISINANPIVFIQLVQSPLALKIVLKRAERCSRRSAYMELTNGSNLRTFSFPFHTSQKQKNWKILSKG